MPPSYILKNVLVIFAFSTPTQFLTRFIAEILSNPNLGQKFGRSKKTFCFKYMGIFPLVKGEGGIFKCPFASSCLRQIHRWRKFSSSETSFPLSGVGG